MMNQKLFVPETKEQSDLENIIKTDLVKKNRIKALSKLRILVGRNEDISTLQVKEYYDSIVGKPSYFKRFRGASIFTYDKDSNIGYNYK